MNTLKSNGPTQSIRGEQWLVKGRMNGGSIQSVRQPYFVMKFTVEINVRSTPRHQFQANYVEAYSHDDVNSMTPHLANLTY